MHNRYDFLINFGNPFGQFLPLAQDPKLYAAVEKLMGLMFSCDLDV
jgi:hypothetical protein